MMNRGAVNWSAIAFAAVVSLFAVTKAKKVRHMKMPISNELLVNLYLILKIPRNLSEAKSPISRISNVGEIFPKFKSSMIIFEAKMLGLL